MTTAVIYARFSSDKQRDASIDDQLRVCNDYAIREGITVIKAYCDYAMSGRSDYRPQFQDMICNAGESDIVLVYMMDRLSRDQYDAPYYKHLLAKKNVRVVSAMEYIPEGADGVLFEKLLEGLAARESMVTSQRTKRGMEGNALKCLYNGDRVYGYDVVDKKYVINETQADFVREAFRRRIDGETFYSIAKDFAQRGVRTYSGKPCSQTMVQTMIRNEKYTGVYIWGEVRIEGGMPVIIDRETYIAAKSKKGTRGRETKNFEKYALSGLAICGECGHNLQGQCAYNHAHTRYDYYADKHIRMAKDKVEGTIVLKLREMLTGDEAYQIAAQVEKQWVGTDGQKAYERAQNSLTEAQKGKENITNAVVAGMPWESVRERFEQLEEQEIRAKADMVMHEHDAEFSQDDFVEFLRFGATLDDDALLGAFVRRVIVYKEKLVVALNYDDEKTNTPKEFTLDVFELETNGSPCVHTLEHGIAVVGKLIIMIIPIAA